MIQMSCILKRLNLPALPCQECSCPWYVNGVDYNNCFWVLSHVMSDFPYGLDNDEIAQLEGITEEEVEEIIETALSKLRQEMKREVKNL